MKRKIISINEDKCNGCGLCVEACHEGALKLVNGKAKLISESYCDGLGDCLPECPTGAISIEEKDAALYNEKAVKKNMEQKKALDSKANCTFQCPGIKSQTIKKEEVVPETHEQNQIVRQSELGQWPCQIKLMSTTAPYLNNAHLLIAADCTAFAYANIHEDFMKGKITLIGCPKLDSVDYSEKLTAILNNNDIKSITVLKMQVPCCTGILNAVKTALKNVMIEDNKIIPWEVFTVSINGDIVRE